MFILRFTKTDLPLNIDHLLNTDLPLNKATDSRTLIFTFLWNLFLFLSSNLYTVEFK